MCYALTTMDHLSATAVCDAEYPEKAAHIMLNKILNDFRTKFGSQLDNINSDQNMQFPELEQYLKTWQNPAQADKLLAVEKNLQDVHEVMRSNLEQMLKRGESIDQLMAKSDDLSSASVSFYKKAKKTNSKCCNV